MGQYWINGLLDMSTYSSKHLPRDVSKLHFVLFSPWCDIITLICSVIYKNIWRPDDEKARFLNLKIFLTLQTCPLIVSIGGHR